MISVEKSYADAAALAAWLTSLAADVTSGKVVGFEISTLNGKVVGNLSLPEPEGLSVELADPEEE